MREMASRGFTLIELMITIAVITIALMLAVPSFSSILANHRQVSVVNSLVNTLQYARNSALRDREAATVCPLTNPASTVCTGDWNTGWGVISKPAAGSSVVLVSSTVGGRGVTVSASNLNPLGFTPRGLVTGLSATGVDLFTVCDKRGAAFARSLVVNAAGYIQASQTPGSDPNGVALACP